MLRDVSTPERAAGEKRYLKSDLDFIGATVPATERTVRDWLTTFPILDREALLALVEALWSRKVHELRMAAVMVLARHQRLLEPSDITLVERLLREARTWALVDELAAVVTGELYARLPELGAALDRWAVDEDFWLRRASMLALLKPLRAGEGDWDRFTRYAESMLHEKEFFIRKAIGWVLRDTSRKRPNLVFEWILPRAARASGVTVREAVRWLSSEQRDAVLAAYKSR